MATSTIMFSRWTPQSGGPWPLRIVNSKTGAEHFEIERDPTVGLEHFDSWSGFITSLHGEQARFWSKDRYFSRGRYGNRDVAGPGITLVGPIDVKRQLEAIIVGPTPPSALRQRIGSFKGGLKTPKERNDPITVLVRKRGIDLQARGHEVAKLLYAGFSAWVYSAGYDFDDVLQEVYRKILVANHGKSPWNPVKSSFGHYVHLICYSALSNFHRKQVRVRSKEQIGVLGVGTDGTWQSVDVRTNDRGGPHSFGLWAASTTRPDIDPVKDLQTYIAKGPHAKHPEAALAVKIVPYVQSGYTLKAIAALLEVDRTSVSRAMKLLRLCAARWAN